MNRITITALAIMAMGACAGMRISQEPRVAKLPPTGMLVTDDSTVGTKSVPVGAIAALVADSGFARVSGHIDSARAAYKADTAKKAAFAYAATYGDTSRAAKIADSAKTVSATALSPYMRRTGDTLARGASLLFSGQTDNPSIQINGAQGYSASLSIKPYGGHAFLFYSYDSTLSLFDNSAGQILLDASVASGMSVYGKSNLWDRIAITNSGHAIWDTIKVLSSDSSINLPKLSLKTTLAPAYGGTGLSAPGATAGNLRWSGSAYAVDTAHYATTAWLANHYVRNDTTQTVSGPFIVSSGISSPIFKNLNGGASFGDINYSTSILGSTVTVTPPVTLTGGIQGKADGSRAASGIVGEVIESKVPNLFVLSIASNTPTNVTSISLTAGDWEVSGGIIMPGSGITSPTSANYTGSISPTSGTHLADGTQVTNTEPTKTTTDSYVSISLPPRTISLTATTTYYLVASRVFSAGTCWAGGYLHARRVR